MFRSFFRSKLWALWAYGGGALLLLSIWLQVKLSVQINEWYGRFYDLLQTSATFRNKPDQGILTFYDQLVGLDALWDGFQSAPSFLVIAMPYVVLATLTSWFTRIYTFRWREAMTFYYLPAWRRVKEDIEGSSQRIQEDCQRFGRILETLGAQVARAIMILAAFLPVLWKFSVHVYPSWLKDTPGSLVWVAVVFAYGGLAISWLVGIKLPGLEYNNQKVEAAFRKELVLGEDNKKDYAGTKVVDGLFARLKSNYQRLFLHYGYFDVWQNSYSQFVVILPFF